MATNLVKHAGGGDLLIETFDDADGKGIEIMALDKGPGMRDPAHCFTDGYSTAGSAGTGLGAISRLADRWDIYSLLGQGTVLMARIRGSVLPRHGGGPVSGAAMQLGVVVTPYPGETVCGDAWAFSAAPTP